MPMKIFDQITNHRITRDVALWIKEQAHAVRIIGGVFLVIALILGFIWMLDVKLDASAFVFSLLASIFFALPSVAEYLSPGRKPIRHMTYDEFLTLLDDEEPQSWKVIYTDYAAEAFLLEDPRLRIRFRHDEAGIHCDDFKAPWANKYPSPAAQSYWYDYVYEGNLIERFIMVDVDNHRATLPLPDSNSTQVQPRRYKVAQIFDKMGTLDEYMQKSGLDRVLSNNNDANSDRLFH